MRYLSVCSGIEAATVAWHSLGWEPVAFSEIESFPCSVLAHHYPGVPNWGDMTRYEEWPDVTVDLLAGGTPCQSFSVAGKRGGMDDIRGQLALAYAGIARKYRPRWLLWENVPGVLSSGGGRDFALFLHTLAELGYGLAYRVLDAQYVRVDSHPRAVPQRRRRVFVVGCFGGWRGAAAVLFEPQSLLGNSAPSREAGERIAGTIASRTSAGGGSAGGRIDKIPHVPVVGNTLTQRMHKGVNSTLDEGQTLVAFHGSQDPCVSGSVTHPVGRNNGLEACVAFDTTQITSPANYSNPQPGDPCHPLAATAHVPAVAIGVNGCAGTLRANQGSGFRSNGTPVEGVVVSALQVRRLTPTECERLQGFPDNYTQVPHRNKPAADGPRYKALGNSFAVNCVRWIGQRIAAVDAIAVGEPGSYDS